MVDFIAVVIYNTGSNKKMGNREMLTYLEAQCLDVKWAENPYERILIWLAAVNGLLDYNKKLSDTEICELARKLSA